MADRDLSGEADQNVQAEGGDGKNADLDQDAEPVFGEHQRRKANQHDAGIATLRLVVVGKIVVSAA